MKVNRIVKQWRYPEASERQLSRSLALFASDLVVFARDQLDGMKFDASGEEIDNAEQSLEDYAAMLIASLVASLPALAMRIYKFNSKQFLDVAKSVGASKQPYIILIAALGFNANESWYNEIEDNWISLTEASYRKLANDIISDWSNTVRLENAKRKSREYIDDVINQRYKVSTGWTVNRSRGIVATWNSLLMRARIDDVGVTHYFWRGKLDERERLKHLGWEGKRIAVDSDHVFPGEEYGCRCWPEPDFSEIKNNQSGVNIT